MDINIDPDLLRFMEEQEEEVEILQHYQTHRGQNLHHHLQYNLLHLHQKKEALHLYYMVGNGDKCT